MIHLSTEEYEALLHLAYAAKDIVENGNIVQATAEQFIREDLAKLDAAREAHGRFPL